MRWRKAPSHTLVARADVQRLTGSTAAEILTKSDTQALVRVAADGSREELLRIPLELLKPPAGSLEQRV
jgi:hypothetical protein